MMQQLTRILLFALLSAAALAQHDGMKHGGMGGMSMGNDTGCANLDICVAGELGCKCFAEELEQSMTIWPS
jgi:hypothetical protein